ncbi:ATP-binding protein [Mesorhizobium sp. M0074]|uniref:ATP-binding protein n=1 Tax=Mesorhizobium sp. M0074 TaxID=2956869 RepID=UPI0033394D8A
MATKILTGEKLPGIGVGGTKIQSQTDALHWQIDDLLVTAEVGGSHLALSCKSNMQVSANGLPADFVQRAWKQWRDSHGPMQQTTDVLALVTRGRHAAFTALWSDIVSWCSGDDPALAIARIRKTQKHTRIFESIQAPGGSSIATDSETVDLIRHLAVIPLDFQLDQSSSVEEAIARCRTLLQTGHRNEAQSVWTDLVQMATDTRVGSGTLTLCTVWENLRVKYRLKDQPSFEGSWNALRALTLDYKARIETALPSGLVIDRKDDKAKLAALLRNQPIVAVFGESGTGKSALVKMTLDELFPAENQVWLGAEQIDFATSEINRSRLQLAYPLHNVLQGSSRPANVLVIDAAEKLDTDALSRTKLLIQRLAQPTGSASSLPWRVVILSQTEGWRDRLQPLIGQAVHDHLAVETISVEDVRTALRASGDLRWLANRDETVAALTNLRILGWVVQASAVFQAGSPELTSPAAIADRIWAFWTQGQPASQNLLIRLAEREAQFVRSFALSELDATDAIIFQNRPAHLPLRKNARNRIEFEHDLAADWVRFQRLKEISHDVDRWAVLANNPLWGGALRLFGQFLLREPAGTVSEWDEVLSVLEAKGATSAADIMLDALCLDPQAARFLNARAELLFSNGGGRLNRLLRRFLHIATLPSAPEALQNVDRALALYMEDRYRTPIIGLWPAMANFLYAHLAQVAELVSPTVADVCAAWLTTTPLRLHADMPLPFREEFAEIALATARALQVDQGKDVIYVGDGERPIYAAAFSGGWDLPDDVATWALEMAQRRPQAAAVAKKIADAKAKTAADHAKRMKSDPEYRNHQKKLAQRRSIGPVSFLSPRKLPPWPLGPKGRVESDFRHVALHTAALTPLMNLRPELADEIMLAAIIEGNPREEESDSLHFDRVGLEYDAESYPTAFWKSQFLTFLQINPDIALTTLIRLVNFAAERWGHPKKRSSWKPRQTTLMMRDGRKKSYLGDWMVFDWTQQESNSAGHLHCALNGLERWLTLQLDQGADIDRYLERLLNEGNSLAFIGLLVNIAKYRSVLLSGVLMPVLSSESVFWLDAGRVKNSRFNAYAWCRTGEAIFNAARDWAVAPYRQRNLLECVSALIPRDAGVAAFLKAAMSNWKRPEAPKEAIEFSILCAQLDEANYRVNHDPHTGKETVEFDCPEAVKVEAVAFQRASVPKLQNLMLAYRCEQVLQQRDELADRDAEILMGVLTAASTEDDSDDKGRQALNRLAAAATLVVCACAWLSARPNAEEAAKSELRAAVDGVANDFESLGRRRIRFDEPLKFAAYGIFHLWRRGGSEETRWEQALLCILTSGDGHAAGVLGFLAYDHRTVLGERWWRLLQLGTLWSALSMFGPDYDDPPDIAVRWQRWLQWLRARRLSGAPCDESALDPLHTWQRLTRLERARWRRQMAAEDKAWLRASEHETTSHGLDTSFLGSFYGWLLADESRPEGAELAIGRTAILSLWVYEAAFCSEHRDERGEYRLPEKFGYDIIGKLAFYAAHVPAERAPEIWRGVLGLGPAAHHLIEHFVGAWFIELSRSCDAVAFCARWRDMIEFALSAGWAKGGHWFDEQRLLLRLLGFGSEAFLTNLPDAAQTVLGMRELYQRWAEANLQIDEENVTGFAYFLASKPGAGLRIDGVKWLSASFAGASREQYWPDRRGTGDALVNLLDVTLQQNALILRRDQSARDALVALASYLVARQIPTALALQERIKRLR